MNCNKPQNKQPTLKEREVARVFEAIEDEITLLTATAKFNHTTCKTDEKILQLTLAYIEDTQKLITVLKSRMVLLETTVS